MKKSLLCLALAILAALHVNSFAAITTGGAGNPINLQTIMPLAVGTMTCTNVAVSTFVATQVLAARTNSVRQGLYVINTSTMALSVNTSRAQDIIWGTQFSTTIPSPGLFQTIPGWTLHPGVTPSTATAAVVNSSMYAKIDGSGVPSGAIFAIAESTGAAFASSATVTACEFFP